MRVEVAAQQRPRRAADKILSPDAVIRSVSAAFSTRQDTSALAARWRNRFNFVGSFPVRNAFKT
jgi:hypothetical protein